MPKKSQKDQNGLDLRSSEPSLSIWVDKNSTQSSNFLPQQLNLEASNSNSQLPPLLSSRRRPFSRDFSPLFSGHRSGDIHHIFTRVFGSFSPCFRDASRRHPSSTLIPVNPISLSFSLQCPSLNSHRLRRIFDAFDKNSDGTITVHELCQALNLLGLDTNPSELDSIVHGFIKLGNTGLEYDDLEALHQSLGETYHRVDQAEDQRACVADPLSLEESDLTEAFKVFDEDGDGFISARELQVVLGKLGLPEGREISRVEQMIFLLIEIMMEVLTFMSSRLCCKMSWSAALDFFL